MFLHARSFVGNLFSNCILQQVSTCATVYALCLRRSSVAATSVFGRPPYPIYGWQETTLWENQNRPLWVSQLSLPSILVGK